MTDTPPTKVRVRTRKRKPPTRVRVRTEKEQQQQPRVRTRTRQRADDATANKTNEGTPGPYRRFADGGTVRAEFIRVGLPQRQEFVGWVVPEVDGSRKGAYLQNQDGTRTFLGWFNGYKNAHSAVARAAVRPRQRLRKAA